MVCCQRLPPPNRGCLRLWSAVRGYLHQTEGASPVLKDGSLDSLVGIGSQPRVQELLRGQVVKQALHIRRIGSDGGEGLLGKPGLALFSRMPFSTSGSQYSVSSSMVLFLCRQESSWSTARHWLRAHAAQSLPVQRMSWFSLPALTSSTCPAPLQWALAVYSLAATPLSGECSPEEGERERERERV